MPSPLNYTTTVPVEKTVGEVSKLLAGAGVASVSTRYTDGSATGLAFTLATPHGAREFVLDLNIDGMQRILTASAATMRKGPTFRTRAHSERVAWRVVKDWLEAQLALIAAEMATLDQVMLPYLVIGQDGGTLYDAYRRSEQAAIEI